MSTTARRRSRRISRRGPSFVWVDLDYRGLSYVASYDIVISESPLLPLCLIAYGVVCYVSSCALLLQRSVISRCVCVLPDTLLKNMLLGRTYSQD